jgi:hypothetical protein
MFTLFQRIRRPYFFRRFLLHTITYVIILLVVRLITGSGMGGDRMAPVLLKIALLSLFMGFFLTIGQDQQGKPAVEMVPEEAAELSARRPSYYFGFAAFLLAFTIPGSLLLLAIGWVIFQVLYHEGFPFLRVFLQLLILLAGMCVAFTLFALVSDRLKLRRYQKRSTDAHSKQG